MKCVCVHNCYCCNLMLGFLSTEVRQEGKVALLILYYDSCVVLFNMLLVYLDLCTYLVLVTCICFSFNFFVIMITVSSRLVRPATD